MLEYSYTDVEDHLTTHYSWPLVNRNGLVNEPETSCIAWVLIPLSCWESTRVPFFVGIAAEWYEKCSLHKHQRWERDITHGTPIHDVKGWACEPPWKMSLLWSMLYMKTAIIYLKAKPAFITEHDMVPVECLTPDDYLVTPSGRC